MQDCFEHGKSLQAEGLFDEAIQAYRAVPDESPNLYKALNNLGTLLEASGQLEDALQAYARASQCKPDSAIIFYNLGHVLQRLGRASEAVSAYLQALNHDPESAETHYNLGNVLSDQARYSSAIGCYQRAIECGLNSPHVHSRLGTAYLDSGRPLEALTEYQQAISLDSDVPEEHFHLGLAYEALRQFDSAAAAYRHTIQLDSEAGAARDALARVLRASGRVQDAVSVYREWLIVSPNHPIPRHMLAALTGEETPDRADSNYVRTLFDGFATSFDQTLARLDYQAPTLLSALIRNEIVPHDGKYAILDAGCGTGLCGPLLKPLAMHLAGVDLSARMLSEAAKRNVYDELLEADLIDFLKEHPQSFDLIVAADTFCYFGDLAPLFSTAALALKPQGWLFFTLEEHSGVELDHKLNAHGRYSHSAKSVGRLLLDCGFSVNTLQHETLRRESNSAVQGLVIAARLEPQAARPC